MLVLILIAKILGAAAELALLASGHLLEALVAVPAIVCLITVVPGLGRRAPGPG